MGAISRRSFRLLIAFSLVLVLLLFSGAWWWLWRNDFASEVRHAGGRIRSEMVDSRTSAFIRFLSGQEAKIYHWIDFEGRGVSDEWLHAHRAEIGQLSNLTLLLRETDITGEGLKALRGMADLDGLILTGTQLTDEDVIHLAAIPNVYDLYIDRTGISDAALAELSQMPNLRFLSIDSTQATSRGIAGLATCSGLRGLMLWDADDESVWDVVQLKGITRLMLIGEDVTSASLPALKRLHGLRTLSLYDAQLSDEEIREVQQALPSCRVGRFQSSALEKLRESTWE